MADLLDALERAERGSGFRDEMPSLSAFDRYRGRRVRRERFVAATLALILAAAAVGTVVTSFRGGERPTPATPSITPTTVGDLRLEWEAQLDGPAASLGNRFATDEPFAPTVVGDTVFVGTEAGTLRAYPVGCRSNGSTCGPLWTADLAGPVAFAPTVADDRVFVATSAGRQPRREPGHLYAFDASCQEQTCDPIWTATIPDTLASAPVVADGFVYGIGKLNSTLYAFAESCHGRCDASWTSVLGPRSPFPAVSNKNGFVRSEAETSPVVSDGTVYAVDLFDHSLHAIDERTRSTRWIGRPTSPVESGVRFNGPVLAGDEVLLEAGSYLYAFPVDCGSDGSTCRPDWMTDKLDPYVGQPVVDHGNVYVGTSLNGQLGHVFSFPLDCRADGGRCPPIWQASVPGELTIEPITVADGQVVVVSNYGDLVVSLPRSCASDTCEPRWQVGSIRQPIMATAGSGFVFVNTGQGRLAAYRTDCRGYCSPLWTRDVDGAVSPPTIVGDTVYAVTRNGALYAFGPGSERRAHPASSDPTLLVYLGLAAMGAVVVLVRRARRARGVS